MARRHHPGDPGSRQGKSPLCGLFAPSLGLTPSGPAQALSKIAPGNFVLGLSLPASGSGEMQRPCKSRPQPASMRAAPARSERLSDFQPDPTPRFNTEPTTISLLLWSTVSQRGVESPLKPANRRPDDKDWTPGRAARGETRHDVESSRPSVSRTGGERSAQHRFPCGAAGIDKGAAVAPLSRSRVILVICSVPLTVNGTHTEKPHISF